MANQQANNAPFLSQQNYAAVAGVSNSPYTDERAVASGGGPGPGAAGNMVFTADGVTPGFGKISYDDNGTNESILAINQTTDFISLSNNGNQVSLQPNANLIFNTGASLQCTAQDTITSTATSGDHIINSFNSDVQLNAPAGVVDVNGETGVAIDAINGDVDITAENNDVNISADNGLVDITGNIVELNSANANASVQVDDGSSSVNVIADDKFRAEVGQNAFPLQNPYDSLLDMTGSNIDMQVVDPLFPPGTLNKTARLQMIEPNALLESEIKMEASEIDLISYASVTNGISLQTRDIAGGIISEFALNSSSANNVPPAVVGRNVQYYQFATWDPNFVPPGEDPVPNPLRPPYRFSTDTGAWRFIDRPNVGSAGPGPLQWNGNGTGSQADPYQLSFASAGVNSLALTYDEPTSTLTLSDPVDGDISSTVVVPGRTILKTDLTVNGTNELSCIGLSNTIFPPPAAGTLVGNNPPRVEIPASGEVPWFPGASFRATIAGTVGTFIANDTLTLRVYSNRGQGSTQRILNTSTITLQAASDVGWKWEVIFTCRDVTTTTPAIGLMASNSKFDYTLNGSPEGSIVSNTNSAFFASSDQYLDFTLQFNNTGNAITTNLCMIERIY